MATNLALVNHKNEAIILTNADPTFEQTVTNNIALVSIPTEDPESAGDYSSGGAGGTVAVNLKILTDDITITCLLQNLEHYWVLYEWSKYDANPKYLVIGNKSFLVQITRLSATFKAGQASLVAINLGLRVTNPE